MSRRSKRMREIDAKLEARTYSLDEAVEILKKSPQVKFDQTVDVAIRMGIDPKKSELQVRGNVSLPHGTGRSMRVLVFAKGEKVEEALAAGAAYAGFEEYYEKVKEGWTEFDAVVATPETMRDVGKLGKVLGPRGLMPTPKAGNVTLDVAQAVRELKGGKFEFKMDKSGVIQAGVGKLSFAAPSLVENVRTLLQAIVRAKPQTAKGQYFSSFFLSSTMGPGLKIDAKELPVT